MTQGDPQPGGGGPDKPGQPHTGPLPSFAK